MQHYIPFMLSGQCTVHNTRCHSLKLCIPSVHLEAGTRYYISFMKVQADI